MILWASIAADKRGHSAPPTCQGGQNEVQTGIINQQTSPERGVLTKEDNNDKEKFQPEESSGNATHGRKAQEASAENTLDQSVQEGITSPADKRRSIGDSRAMNVTPLSVMQVVLLNKNKSKKSKFTVELEERKINGKSRIRIDIWEVDEETAPKIDGAINRPNYAQARQPTTPKGRMIQRERQYPSATHIRRRYALI